MPPIRGLHSFTSQLNMSRFGQRVILCPFYDELWPIIY